MRPRAAQMRQQQSQQRRARLMESATRAQMQSGSANRTGMNPTNVPLNRFVFTNRQRNYRDPNRGIITQAQWDQVVQRHEDSGKVFRYVFATGIVFCLLFLFFAKYDEEYNVEVPQLQSGHGFAGEAFPNSRYSPNKDSSNGAKSLQTIPLAQLQSYYETLGVQGRLRPTPRGNVDTDDDHDKSTTFQDADKERRRENYRVRQQVKKAYMDHQEQQGQLVHCGRACESSNKQVELAYTTLASQVDRELFGVLLDAKDTKSARSTTPQLLKQKYEEKKKKIMETQQTEEDRSMALQELKDAYDILVDPDARKYYLLYGAKPPQFLRHVSARHGGWGQEMTLGTYKYRIIIMWLDFLHKYIGVWGETAVLLCVLVFVLVRLPNAMKQVQSIIDEMGLNDDEEEGSDEGKKNNGTGTSNTKEKGNDAANQQCKNNEGKN